MYSTYFLKIRACPLPSIRNFCTSVFISSFLPPVLCFILAKKRPPKTINSIINTRNMATESNNTFSTAAAALYGHQSRLVSAQSSCFHCCFFFFILFSHKSRLDDVYALSTLPQHEASLPFLGRKQDFSFFFPLSVCVCVCVSPFLP